MQAGADMPRNIVILLDGTSNEISSNRTNILRLYGALEKSDRQLVYYDPGVGTFGAENAWLRLWRKTVEIWGLATGWGLDHNVKEAYRFLVENYVDGRGGGKGKSSRDNIYIFGFSRGAYTARVLAGFIHAVGLIEKRNLNLLDYAYSAYKGIGENGEDKFGEVRLYERILAPDRPPVRLLGLFDTVASVIESGRYGPRLRSHAYTRRNLSVESVRHAVAIDERRTMFGPQLWPEGEEYWGNPFNKAAAKPQDVREVWFSGVHGDVGGGYPETESGLAKVALQWMVEQTSPLGLFYRTQAVNELVLGRNSDGQYISPDPHAKPHNSMNLGWSVLEFLPQWRRKQESGLLGWRLTIPLFTWRSIPVGARIHKSVANRVNSGHRPPNMPKYFMVE
jgi:uncharacterized protein (DUF2235 family)